MVLNHNIKEFKSSLFINLLMKPESLSKLNNKYFLSIGQHLIKTSFAS